MRGAEVDFVLGEAVAIEVKATRHVQDRQLRGLQAILQQPDYRIRRRMVVCQEPGRRSVAGIEIVPWRECLADLWANRVL